MNREQNSSLVLPLDDAAASLARVGGKGASLARMAAAGLPVPPGFHITTAAYDQFVAQNHLEEAIAAAVAPVSADDPAALDAASARIQGLFAGGAMPAAPAAAIREAYATLGNGVAVAVRSSATAEDLPEMSFAGQQETYLNIQGADAVIEAVKQCWASLWTARAIAYRLQRQINQDAVSMAVVAQELVPAEAAGIMFTANPLTGSRGRMVVNAAWGLGEAIVGGQVTPDMVVIDKTSGKIVEQQVNAKDVMTVRTPTGTREEPVPAERRRRPVLDAPQAAELARLGGQIERLYGRPMDVEWALAGGHIYILQARPITALPPMPASEVEWVLPNPNGNYMRASVLELLPDPLSPLFAGLGLKAYSDALIAMTQEFGGLEGFFNSGDVLTTINGYGYYDLSYTPMQTLKVAAAMPGFLALLPLLLRRAQPRWEAARSQYAALVERWQASPLDALSAAELLAGVRDLTNEAMHYYVTVQSGILPAAYMTEALFTQVYDRLLKRRGDPSALTFMLGFDSVPIEAEKSLYDLAQWVAEQPQLRTELAAMTGEGFAAAYLAPAADTPVSAALLESHWSEFWVRLREYLDRFGHTIYDLDFAKAVPADDPAPVLQTLKFFMSGDAPSPYTRQATAAAQRQAAMTAMRERLHGLRRDLFNRLLASAQRFAPLREDALADVGLGWPILRRMLREIGRRLVTAGVFESEDDVFWLKQDELAAAAAALDAQRTPTPAQTLVAERRATWQRQRAVKPPIALPLHKGVRFLGVDFSAVMPERSGQPEGAVLHGVGGSPGSVTGSARVLGGPEEFGQMRRGDILVARITTPAWTPLFALAAGVVTDVGGPLSHSSIVAREYHIPAVLGTGSATERLHSGEQITVDGSAGTVTILETADETVQAPQSAAKARRSPGPKAVAGLAVTAASVLAVLVWRRMRRRR